MLGSVTGNHKTIAARTAVRLAGRYARLGSGSVGTTINVAARPDTPSGIPPASWPDGVS